MPAQDGVTELARLMQQGLTEAPTEGGARQVLEALFGERYHAHDRRHTEIRDAYGRAADPAHVPFAGLIAEGSPTSGPYGGMSLVWFPVREGGSLLTFVVGTLGLSPDESVLGRHGYRRRLAGMRAHLRRAGIEVWTKPEPTAVGLDLPSTVRAALPQWESAFDRYGAFIYACSKVGPEMDVQTARRIVAAFLDVYAHERNWHRMARYAGEIDTYLAGLHADIFRNPSIEEVSALLMERRFVVLQGSPGTGKTRMSDLIHGGPLFEGRGPTVQFHPAVTYEDFVVGLAPEPGGEGLRFRVRAGSLLQAVEAAQQCSGRPVLLQIDEVNRGDLGKVLGEAIYLFEPREVGGDRPRRVVLPHPWNGSMSLELPANLYVLGSMNTADRSIAGLDLAVRRRFAFLTLHPDRSALDGQAPESALEIFDRLTHTFVEHASDEALMLLPGHAYYLAATEAELRRRVRYELLPLLDEYLAAGLLGGASLEVRTTRDWIADHLGESA